MSIYESYFSPTNRPSDIPSNLATKASNSKISSTTEDEWNFSSYITKIQIYHLETRQPPSTNSSNYATTSSKFEDAISQLLWIFYLVLPIIVLLVGGIIWVTCVQKRENRNQHLEEVNKLQVSKIGYMYTHPSIEAYSTSQQQSQINP